jgi:hypothetical protein
VLQHEQMTGLSAVGAVGLAVAMNKLFFLHVGNQKPNQFDNDNPPMIGMDGLKEFISILYLLAKADWKGYIEFDNHMLRTDGAPGMDNKIALRRRSQAMIWNAAPEVGKALASGSHKEIAAIKINYEAVAKAPVRIGELDHLVNRKILGM